MRKKIFGYHLNDARSIQKVIKWQLVDVIITSPPYAEMKNYGIENQIGYGQNYEQQYKPDLENVFSQCLDITKATGSLWIIMDTFRLDGGVRILPFDIANILERIGWRLKDIIIWEKDKALPWTGKGQLRNIFEYILFFVKSDNYKYYIERIKETEFKEWWIKYPERYNPHGKVPTNIWKISIPIQGSWTKSNLRHFCPFPAELVEKILHLASDEGDVVLDPFAGSGIVLAQAQCMKRKAIGFDIINKYKDMYENHVLHEVKERWRQRKKDLRKIQNHRHKIQQQISKLRQLKYPKVLFRELRKVQNSKEISSTINSIFAISVPLDEKEKIKKHIFLKVRIYLVFENDVDYTSKEKEIDKIVSKPPLSKYGILPIVYLKTFREFIETTENDPIFTNKTHYWLYSEGRTHKYERSISLDEWQEYGNRIKKENNHEGDIPPIVSNIEIDIQ